MLKYWWHLLNQASTMAIVNGKSTTRRPMLTHQHLSTNHQSVLQSSSSNIHQYHSSFFPIIQPQISISTTPRLHLAHAAYSGRLTGTVRGRILEKPHRSSVHIDGPNPAKESRVKRLQRITEYLPCRILAINRMDVSYKWCSSLKWWIPHSWGTIWVY